jgi:hypothetical protein
MENNSEINENNLPHEPIEHNEVYNYDRRLIMETEKEKKDNDVNHDQSHQILIDENHRSDQFSFILYCM